MSVQKLWVLEELRSGKWLPSVNHVWKRKYNAMRYMKLLKQWGIAWRFRIWPYEPKVENDSRRN